MLKPMKKKPSPGPAPAPRFDSAAGTYDSYGGVQREMADWLAEWLPDEKSGGALELGAGTGFFTRHLLPWPGTLVATDLSPGMVATGRQHYPQIPWRVRDAGATGEEKFDWIFSCSFLQWSPDPDPLLEAWRQQLRPGGRVLSGFFVDGALPALHDLLGKHAPLLPRGEKDWIAHFENAGFRIRAIETREHSRSYPSALDLFRCLHRIGATGTPRMSVVELKQLLRTYGQTCRRPDGNVEGTWKYTRVLAER